MVYGRKFIAFRNDFQSAAKCFLLLALPMKLLSYGNVFERECCFFVHGNKLYCVYCFAMPKNLSFVCDCCLLPCKWFVAVRESSVKAERNPLVAHNPDVYVARDFYVASVVHFVSG